ncbi:MAG TPA: hypothetical protein VIY86_08475, partial [Pirellulaceae bacterium]
RQLESSEALTTRLTQGELMQSDSDMESIPGLDHALRRVLISRGRVWRGGLAAQAAGNQVLINMQAWGDDACARVGLEEELDDEVAEPAPLEEGAAPAGNATPVASRPHEIAKDMFLFVFLELPPGAERIPGLYGDSELPQKDTKGACRLPALFLGRFKVTQSTEQAVQLEAPYPLPESAVAALANAVSQRATCALYEVMPKDGYDVWQGLAEEELRSILRPPKGADPAEWSRRIQGFLRDGKAATDDDPDFRKWVRVKFLKDVAITVDAGDDEIVFDRAYDAAGRAILPPLKQGGPTEFKKDQEVLLHFPTAQELVQNGNAELTDDPAVFRRPLRDYELILHQGEVDLESERQLERLLMGDKGSLNLATDKARLQIQSREAELAKLREDSTQFEKELTAIRTVERRLTARYQAQRRELSQLYQSNLGLREQLLQRGGRVSSRLGHPDVGRRFAAQASW